MGTRVTAHAQDTPGVISQQPGPKILDIPTEAMTVALYDLTFAHARLKAANAGGSAVVRPGTALGVCAKVVAVLDKTIAAHAQISDASRT